MCNFASTVLTKDHVFFGTTDSHEDIIRERKLHEGAGRVNILRVEICPMAALDSPIDGWAYRVDQDTMPKWYDAERDEARARAALCECGLAPLYADYEAKRAPLDADDQA